MIKPLHNSEIQELLFMFLNHITKLQDELDKGNLKGDEGYTPQPGTDYMTSDEARDMLTTLFREVADNVQNDLSMTKGEVSKMIQAKLDTLTPGKDAEITDELIEAMVGRVHEAIELPDFAELFTKEPEAIRDALELLNGDERLDQSAIKDLPEDLKKLEERVSKKMTLVPVGARDVITLSQITDLYIQDTDPGDVKENSIWIRTA